jgi:class 3 adenylate cyclase/tetratricopeptide (TPR) repeat protein
LAFTCPGCGFENDLEDAFCGGCGKPTTVAASTPEPEPSGVSPESAPESFMERRQVTIIFTDLSGFTHLAESLAQEELHRVMQRFFTDVDDTLLSYGGVIDKHIGDAVMALFGAPIAHDNDHERAVRAAIDLHSCLDRLSKEMEYELKVHIGIASGLVVASDVDSGNHHEYTVLGDSVNLASRLVNLASPGETLISDEVCHSVADIFSLEDLGQQAIKGIAKPVRVWKVTGVTAGDDHRRRLPLFGRRREMQQFEGILETFGKIGTGQVIHLCGEAGIGKSRLVEEFSTMAMKNSFVCHSTLLLNFGVGKQRDGIRCLVNSLLELDLEASQQECHAIVHETLSRGLLDSGQSVFLNILLDLPLVGAERTDYDAMDNQRRVRGKQDVVLTLLDRLSRVQPLMVIIEDLHWSDPLILDYVTRISQLTISSPILLVMSSRPEVKELGNSWYRLLGRALITTMNLAPLDETDAMALAGQYVETNNQFSIECVKRAEGNPLFLDQLLRSAETMGAEQVPGSIRSIVLSRVDCLAAEDKLGLQAASILGQRFTIDDVQYLIEDDEWTGEALLDLQLIRTLGDEYLFAHALIWESVYSTLLKKQLGKLHRRAANLFGKKDLSLKAEHLERAGSPGAPAAFLAAALEQIQFYKFESARIFAESGLAIVKDQGERYGLQMCLGECLRELGEPTESIENYEKALQAATTDIARCRAWIGLAAGMRDTDSFSKALEILDKAETTATGDPRLVSELSQIHYYRGNIYFPLGKIDGCLEQHQKALAYAQKANSEEHEVRALSGLGDAYYSSGRMKNALEYFEKCVAMSEQNGFGRIAVSNQYMVAWTLLYMCLVDRSLEMAARAVDSAVRAGQPRSEMVARLSAARSLFENGQYYEAGIHVERGLAIVETLQANRFEAFFLIFRVRLAHAEKHIGPDTIRELNVAISQSRESGLGFLGPWLLSTLALVSSNSDIRSQALAEGETVLKAGCVGHNYFAFYENAMEISLSIGNFDEAERYADALEAYMRAEPLPLSLFHIELTRTLINYHRHPGDEVVAARLLQLQNQASSAGLNHAANTLQHFFSSKCNTATS